MRYNLICKSSYLQQIWKKKKKKNSIKSKQILQFSTNLSEQRLKPLKYIVYLNYVNHFILMSIKQIFGKEDELFSLPFNATYH